MICPYRWETKKEVIQTIWRYNDDQQMDFQEQVVLNKDNPAKCKKEQCAVWRDGRCCYKE